MIYFDLETLTKLLSDLSNLVETNISIYDENFKCTEAHGAFYSPLCSSVKLTNKSGCKQSDNTALMRTIDEEAFYYYCHFGFIEMMIKKKVGGTPLYICVGPFRDKNRDATDLNKILKLAKVFKKSESELIEQYKRIPKFSEEKFHAILGVVDTLVEYAKKTKTIAVKEDYFDQVIEPYVKENIGKQLSVTDLCDHFGIPQKRFQNIIRKATGLTPKRYLTEVKIEKAYQEILLTDKELTQIAKEVGIEDYNYFIKVFKLIKHRTPKYFRKEK